MAQKIIRYLFIILGLLFLLHNLYFYPVDAGYDASLHLRYADILTREWRLPTLAETREAYNPPLFYLLSGLTGRLVSYLTGQDFFSALKAWQYLNLFFVFLFIYFWRQILRPLLPKSKLAHVSFVVLLFSLPVFQKTLVMFNLELFSALLMSWGLWYCAVHFLPRPTVSKTIFLAGIMILNLLTRMSSFVLLLSLLVGFLGFGLIKKISWLQTAKYLSIFFILVFLGCSWFYFGQSQRDIYGVGEGGEPDIPLFKRQPLAFYTEIPFTLMMNYPIRFAPNTPLNRLIPIYYSEFWGDWWNYFSQRRFDIPLSQIRQDRYFTSQARVNSLAWQNRLNLPLTLLIIIGFISLFWQTFTQTFKKIDTFWLIKAIIISLTSLTYLGWLVMITKYPGWKGDSIKASYMFNVLPVLAFSAINFLFNFFRKSQIVFTFIIAYLIINIGVNLWWSWY